MSTYTSTATKTAEPSEKKRKREEGKVVLSPNGKDKQFDYVDGWRRRRHEKDVCGWGKGKTFMTVPSEQTTSFE